MRGIVLSYDRKQKKGLISGDDGNRYTFSTEDWNLSLNPEKGLKVDFEREGKKAKDFVLIEEKKQESFVTQVIFVFVLLGFGYLFLNIFSYLGSNGSPEINNLNEKIRRNSDKMQSDYCAANHIKCD